MLSGPVPDNIPASMTKDAAPISFLINHSFETGTFPSTEKTANVTPLYKSGERNSFNNYRPISVLKVILKVVENDTAIMHHLILEPPKFGIWKQIDSIADRKLKRNAETLPILIKNAFSKSTLKKYKPAWEKWLQWSSKFEEISQCPADPLYVTLYLNDIVSTDCKVGTITAAFLGIRWGHISSGLPSPTEDCFVKLALEGGQRMLSKNTVRNQKEILSQEIITTLTQRFVASKNLLEIRNIVLVLLGFTGFMRISKVLQIPSEASYFHRTRIKDSNRKVKERH